jgi:5-methylcytosine-specific restriction endonuclease McrA
MAFSETTKEEALRRAGGMCECERGSHGHIGRCYSTDQLEYHHKTAVASGGSDALSNCEVLCHDCHQQVRRPS